MQSKTPLTLLLGAGLGLGAGVLLAPRLADPFVTGGGLGANVQAAAVAQTDAALQFDPRVSLAPLVKELAPTVVHIQVEQQVQVDRSGLAPFFGLPFSTPQPDEQERYRTRQGQGSGFVISEDGLILTNNHVVDDADKVTVTLSDDTEYAATVLGSDPRTDVALVRIDADVKLPVAKLGSSEAVEVGDWVVAIGNPFGLDHSVSTGILSGKGRRIGAGPYDAFLQTDASINPGNSGGPLFNLKGEVVGINTAIIGQGIGFAVPIDMVTEMLDELEQDGHVARGWMGVGLKDLDASLAGRLGVEPAALVQAIGRKKPGDKVKVGVLRDGREKELKVALGERPDEQDLARGRWRSDGDAPAAGGDDGVKLGVVVRTPRSLGMGDEEGVVVTRVDGEGAASGALRAGDRIVQANGEAVRKPEDLGRALQKDEKRALLVVVRQGGEVLLDIPLTAD
jgi:serine protease Do